MDILKLVKTYEPVLILGNINLENVRLIAEHKHWLDDNWIKQLQNMGIERYALVNGDNVLKETLYEELFQNIVFHVNFFDQRDKAYNWLIDKSLDAVANID